MSAPLPAPGDDRPREGYYPDPSIPGYVRYWNGVSWVPGTSRPAPMAGESLPAPQGAGRPQPAAPEVEETGPHFFDEDPPAATGAPAGPEDDRARPEPASAWGADVSRQSGFGGAPDHRVSWGAPTGPDPRVPQDPRPAAETPADPSPSDDRSGGGPSDDYRSDGTMTIRGLGRDAARTGPDGTAADGDDEASGTMMIRRPDARDLAAAAERGARSEAVSEGTMAIRAVDVESARRAGAAPGQVPPQTRHPEQTSPQGPQAAPLPDPSPEPEAGGGRGSWAQQVQHLAQSPAGGEREQAVVPWKPPAEDPFLAVAQAQASARPAPLGRRFAARLLDSVVLGAVCAIAGVPLLGKAADHVDGKIDAAKQSGRTVTVWLLDGTTAAYAGAFVLVLLLFGVLYEALPISRGGRTLGKRLLGIEVRDIEGHRAPGFGAAVRRWLVYCVPGLLLIGVVGVAWCLFDRPWRQCWHDKAAGTFVASSS
ncbi:RDD family protein [Streptomyces sp. NPDC058045]|uniref:RDD family protein n=1 Tax=Streptomyces sp. NPDC058045 TaxID=3346311 RepID=UPI0036EE6376